MDNKNENNIMRMVIRIKITRRIMIKRVRIMKRIMMERLLRIIRKMRGTGE